MAKYHLTRKADEYYSALVKTFAEIAKRPCHLDKEYVEIVRILHEKMDIASNRAKNRILNIQKAMYVFSSK